MNNIDSLYFDYQATTPVDERVLARMLPYFQESFGNPHSSEHSFGWQSSRAVDQSVGQISSLIGADTDEIIFTSGATEANNMALLGLARHDPDKNKRNRIILSAIEHKCVLAVGRVLENKLGFQVDTLPVDKSGRVSPSDLEHAIDDDVLAVSIMAVNNEIGTIQDIARIYEIVRQTGALFHCDAAQAPMAIEMHDFVQNVDLMSLSAHKIYGPKGIGVLYARRDIQNRLEPLIYGGGQQSGLRSGTIPTPLVVGMGVAAEILNSEDTGRLRTTLRERRDRFVKKLSGLPWPIMLNGPAVNYRHPGNANICFKDFSSHDILNVLQPRLAASTGSACASGTPEPSHVLRAIGLSHEDAESSIRFSLGLGTSDGDIDKAVRLIGEALSRLSDTSPKSMV